MAHTALYTQNWSKKMQSGRSSVVARLRHRIYDPLSKIFFLVTVARTKVRIQKREYPYLVHWSNYTWTNERAVEIPYFSRLVTQYTAPKILEIGNTLAHYMPITHIVVDKYETGSQVENIDVVDFKSRGKFDLIFAISTLEHVGWHEKEKRAEKAIEAITHLRGLLSPTGRLVFSFPLGVNPSLDKAIRTDSLTHAKLIFLRRKNRLNMWEETSYTAVKTAKYNEPYPNANAICIVIMTK